MSDHGPDPDRVVPYHQEPGSVQPHWPPPTDPSSLGGVGGATGWGGFAVPNQDWLDPAPTGFDPPTGPPASYPPPAGFGPPGGYPPAGDYPPGGYPPAGDYPPPAGYGPFSGYGPSPDGYRPAGSGYRPGSGGYSPGPAYGRRGTDRLAIASLVLGILSVTFGFIFVIPPILAIVFGAVALSPSRYGSGTERSRPLATAGLILGILTLLGAIALYSYLGASGRLDNNSNQNSLAARRAVAAAVPASTPGPPGPLLGE